MDEFYTRREDIEAELLHYKAFFEGKVVYCNCDDPTWSEFWQFFVRVFRDWKIKKLMATHYEPDEKNYAYKLELTEDTNGDGKIDWQDEPTITQIPCNGDFRSAICIEMLKPCERKMLNYHRASLQVRTMEDLKEVLQNQTERRKPCKSFGIIAETSKVHCLMMNVFL